MDSLRILHRNWTVLYDSASSLDRDRVHGWCDDSRSEIHLPQRDNAEFGLWLEVLIHEITHAVQLTLGIDSEAELTCEEFTLRTSIGWATLLRDNPGVKDWMSGQTRLEI